jgi:hypothetical protein
MGRFKRELLITGNLKRASIKPIWINVTVEDSIVEFVAAFAQSGPGMRKLLRFGFVLDTQFKQDIGPLVEVSSPVAHVLRKTNAGDVDVGEENPAITNSKRIFKQAYHAPRVAHRTW